MSKVLIGDKIFANASKILREKGLDEHIAWLQQECDAIDFYQARYPDQYKEIQSFITNNKGKKLGDKDYDWGANYPFDSDNIIRFAKFCKESGGFTIC